MPQHAILGVIKFNCNLQRSNLLREKIECILFIILGVIFLNDLTLDRKLLLSELIMSDKFTIKTLLNFLAMLAIFVIDMT